MKFRRLKLVGFKSFVEPAELRIEPGLTGIVGPNGCGKSNLLEAIRWVMGESSAKSMRGGGMEDVIFAGTTTRPSRDFAEVQLDAERDEGEDRELEVIRRIERGAGSAYRVNGRDVRAKDVALIFADAATGAHSPALVSQGRIGAVIAAKPTERRAMLEEAAGIAGLHVRRKDAEQKLRATETNLTRLDELVADMENRIAQLRRQARQAERYSVLSADIRVAEARLIFARWRDAAAAADVARGEAEAADKAVALAAEQQRAAAAWASEATRAVADARAAAQAARDRVSDIGHRLAALRGERAALDRRIADIAAQRERLAADREREGALAHDAADAIARLTAEMAEIDARVVAAEAERPARVQATHDADAATRDAEVELARALAAQAAEQAEARVAQAALAAATGRLERSTRDLDRLMTEVAGIGDAGALEAARDRAGAERQQAESAAAAAAATIEQSEAARAEAAARRDTAESAVAASQAALSALEGEHRALSRAVATSASDDRVIDRMRVAPGYERALATALGDDLDAGAGADGARRWAGAAVEAGDPPLPAGVEALVDHVDAPSALARRLAQVAVVDRDDGQRLAVGQRLVTRDGQLRRWDGFVARDVGAAAAERLIRVNRLGEIDRALPAARDVVEEAAGALGDARAAVQAAGSAIDRARAVLAEAEKRARTAQRDEDQAVTAIERLAARRAELDERIARATAERDEAVVDHGAARDAALALPDGTATAQLVASLQKVSEAARDRAAQAKVDVTTLDRAIAADRDRRAAAAGEVKGWRSRAGEAARRIDEMTKRAAAAEAEAATLADAPADMDQRIAALAADHATASAESAALVEAERSAETGLRESEQVLAAAAETVSQAREERAGAVARAEGQELRRVEMGRVAGERFECPPPVLPEKVGFASADVGDASGESARLERLTLERERIGPVNLIAERELEELEADHTRSVAERDELGQAINRLRGSIGSLNREGRARLLAAFEAVDGHFRRLFTTLFNGGEAYLQLVDSDDPLEAGLEIMAQPPGKKLAALTLLSGGEQALTAVALIFGLFLTNPAPICVLDEVDAPLDDANIERFCDLLDAMTRETDTRYLIVTHNAVTMARMHRLFGVTMIEQGVSRLVSVDLGGAERLLAAE
jgi:chromosome segregation protein